MRAHDAAGDQLAVEAVGLEKSYGRVRVLDGVDTGRSSDWGGSSALDVGSQAADDDVESELEAFVRSAAEEFVKGGVDVGELVGRERLGRGWQQLREWRRLRRWRRVRRLTWTSHAAARPRPREAGW